MNRALADPKPVSRPSAQSFGSGVTDRPVPATLAMQRSSTRCVPLTALRPPATARLVNLLPSDCPPAMAVVSRRAARENLLNDASARRQPQNPCGDLSAIIAA